MCTLFYVLLSKNKFIKVMERKQRQLPLIECLERAGHLLESFSHTVSTPQDSWKVTVIVMPILLKGIDEHVQNHQAGKGQRRVRNHAPVCALITICGEKRGHFLLLDERNLEGKFFILCD